MKSQNRSQRIRLHKFVKEELTRQGVTDYTNPEIQRNIELHGVKVDGIDYRNRLQWVYPTQRLEVNWPKRDHGNLNKIKVVAESENYLVIFKPPGVVVQAGAGHQKDNLVTWLLEHYPEQGSFDGDRFPGRGLVHRLDKLTQGLLLIARSPEALQYFQDQFRNRTVQKKYLAVVENTMIHKYHIKNYQARSKNNPIKNKLFWDAQESLAYDQKARYAESYFTPIYICRELNQTLVEVEIKTGRMHQIRLQAQAINHALVFDPKYPKMTASIPKAKIFSTDDFASGVYKEKYEGIHNIDAKEFEALKKSIFSDTDFCLLSNYLRLKKMNGEELAATHFTF